MIYIIDSYAWIEYFIGSTKGELLKRLFSNKNNDFLTVECCLAEVGGWALKHNTDVKKIINIIQANSRFIKITEKDWVYAARERFEQRKTQKDFGLIDAVILVKQKELKSKIITGDKHFRGMRNVVFLE